MTGRTATFNQRIVKVVVPTLEAKDEWGEAAKRDGFEGNLSGWLRHLVAERQGGHVAELEEQAGRVKELEERVKTLEAERDMLRDAYAKVRADLADATRRATEIQAGQAVGEAQASAKHNALALGLVGLMSGKTTPAGKRSTKPPSATLDDIGKMDTDQLLATMRELGYLKGAPKPRPKKRGGDQ